MKRISYPFSAIVGQEKMKLALMLNAVDPRVGGVLIRGEKGTAKSTAARGLAELLPEIEVVKDCPFSCDPQDTKGMCDACLDLHRERKIEISKRKMRVVDLPMNATEDRVAGTLNIEQVLREGVRALEPGILAEANRGVLYIDEVNLLDDHVADLLLDAAAMGMNVVEREGISVCHPSRFILVGTMNPEEGELRPQLVDRFGLSVRVEHITDVSKRKEIVLQREAFEKNPHTFLERSAPNQGELVARILSAVKIARSVELSKALLTRLIEICVELGVDGHRADIVTSRASKAIAALDGRDQVTEEDLLGALELTLEHRMRRQPFEKMELDRDRMKQMLHFAQEPLDSTESEKKKPTERLTI